MPTPGVVPSIKVPANVPANMAISAERVINASDSVIKSGSNDQIPQSNLSLRQFALDSDARQCAEFSREYNDAGWLAMRSRGMDKTESNPGGLHYTLKTRKLPEE